MKGKFCTLNKSKGYHRKVIFKKKINNSFLNFAGSNFVITVLKPIKFSDKQIESCRILFRRELKKKTSFEIIKNNRIPITTKSEKMTKLRMGKGKGKVNRLITYLKIFSNIFILKDVTLITALKLMRKISYRLPFQMYLIDKNLNMYLSRNCV